MANRINGQFKLDKTVGHISDIYCTELTAISTAVHLDDAAAREALELLYERLPLLGPDSIEKLENHLKTQL